MGLLLEGLFAHRAIESVKSDRHHRRLRGAAIDRHDLQAMVERSFRRTPLVVDPAHNSGMPIRYDNPSEVGADRIVNAIAAYEQFGGGANCP